MGQIIDGHYHFSRTAKASRYENLEEMIQYMKIGQLEAVCVHNIVLWETKALLRNPLAILAKIMEPERIYAFGGVIYPQPEKQWEPFSYRSQAQELIDMGFDGIKVQNKPLYKKEWKIPYYHENFDDFWGWLEQEQIPIMFHIGDPKEFWDMGRIPKRMYDFGWYYGKGIPPYEAYYEETERILQKFPKLNLTIPHFYFLSDDLKRCLEFMERYPKVKLDITPGSEMYFNFSVCQDFAREFFIRYQDRILFGTDNHGGDEDSAGEEQRNLGIQKIQEMRGFLEQENCIYQNTRLRGLSLPEETLEKIYRGNFLRWVGKRPKPICLPKAEKMVKEVCRMVKEREDGKDLVPDAEKILARLEELSWQ